MLTKSLTKVMLKILIHIQIIIEYIYTYIYHNPIFIYDNIYLVKKKTNFSYSLNVLADDLLSIVYYNMINNT